MSLTRGVFLFVVLADDAVKGVLLLKGNEILRVLCPFEPSVLSMVPHSVVKRFCVDWIGRRLSSSFLCPSNQRPIFWHIPEENRTGAAQLGHSRVVARSELKQLSL